MTTTTAGHPGQLAEALPASEIVNSHTEWDPLEEVLVGRMVGGVFPTWQPSMRAVLPDGAPALFRERGGSPFPTGELEAAEHELETFAAVLEAEGVHVVRPEPMNHSMEFSTPDWRTSGGLYAAMPRDLLMVIGRTIIEAPMSWRCRYHEIDAYRNLIKSYFHRGAGWLQAPRPQLTEDTYSAEYRVEDDRGYAITEFEPVFDAADFSRFGRDIIAQKSHVTNEFGIRWLQRAIGDDYRIHCIEVNDPHAMHIDATIAPLAPGKLLVHPDRYVPNELFRDWEIIPAPKPTLPSDWPMYFCSPWVSMNVLSLDPHTVVVESHEHALIDLLGESGFRVIPLDFRHVYSFGGSFHCVTVDLRRRGALARYLS